MKNLEKLDTFQLSNEQLQNVKGGDESGKLPGGGKTTGAGQYTIPNWPSQGVTTCVDYTADAWDGFNAGTMVHTGETYTQY
ncbi:hypothetical protein [Chryseobacterium gregarium]|uniref:hypothetical protein n=1 Tax=Chryseobacterium gregarium TaxID=456299 RepID=UPI000428CB9F|nr:hypothetical protein [Chryseobacterium gregarium]